MVCFKKHCSDGSVLHRGPEIKSPAGTRAMNRASLPQEMTDAILDNLGDDLKSLIACSTVCKAWVVSARRLFFRFVSVHCDNIARFLTSGRAIFPFIRHLMLEDFETHHVKKWNDHLPSLSKERFDRVQSLTLMHILWNLLFPEAQRAIMTQFTGIVCLRLSEIGVDGFADLSRLICAFPHLESLVLDDIEWDDSDTDSSRRPPFPTNLRELETRDCRVHPILEWLLSSEKRPLLHTLYIHFDDAVQSNALDRLLPLLGISLQKLEICFDAFERPINLSANECLTLVKFEVAYQDDCEWILESLLTITSPHLEEVWFIIDGEEYSDENVNWGPLDAILAGQQFPKLSRVVTALKTWEGHTPVPLPHLFLPRCYSRDILFVAEVNDTYWDI